MAQHRRRRQVRQKPDAARRAWRDRPAWQEQQQAAGGASAVAVVAKNPSSKAGGRYFTPAGPARPPAPG
jgi:hypothetical protein